MVAAFGLFFSWRGMCGVLWRRANTIDRFARFKRTLQGFVEDVRARMLVLLRRVDFGLHMEVRRLHMDVGVHV